MPRKLILQATHYSLDGFIAAPNNDLPSWINTNFSPDLNAAMEKVQSTVTEILLGRKLAEGFVPAWKSRPSSEPGAHFMNNTLKTVFSSTLEDGALGENVRVLRGGVMEEVRKLKEGEGGNMIVYGGVEFMQTLVKEGLIDEFYLLMHGVALGEGARLFTSRVDLEVVEAQKTECGIMLVHLRPKV